MGKRERARPQDEIGLRELVLPGKKEFKKILTDIGEKSNPCEVSDLLLKPFYEIMGNIKRGMR